MEETVFMGGARFAGNQAVPLRGSSFTFGMFASDWGPVTFAPLAPPPAIIDDEDGMAHIAPDFCVDKGNLDKGLLSLIADVFHRGR